MPGIFLKVAGDLVAMREAPYDTEAVLQELIAEHPETLVGDPEAGGSWLLIRREAAVYDEDDLNSRGSLDHLFLDTAGVPTLVEVKRATDSRIRREVVGQMLDYAAGAANWKVERLRGWLEARCDAEGLDADDVLLGHADDADTFWMQVQTNLAARRLRLVFVADDIPPALRAIIEFLNEQMTECEVIAIEVRQYKDAKSGHMVIAPSVLGRTQAANEAKGKRHVRHWHRTSVLEDLRAKCKPDAVATAMRILDWGDANPDLICQYGHGAVDGSVQFGVLDGSRRIFPFVLYTNGAVEIPFARMAAYAPFRDEPLLEQYRQRVATIDGVELPPDPLTKRPSISLDVLAAGDALSTFLVSANWALQQK
jgi:hypothetical protein